MDAITMYSHVDGTVCSCATCVHKQVCPHKELFDSAKRKINMAVVDVDAGSLLRQVKVECKYYLSESNVVATCR